MMETITIEKGTFERWMRMIFDRLDRHDRKLDAIAKRKDPALPEVIGEKLYDVPALAEVFGVTANTIYRWKRRGIIPLRKIGGKNQMWEHEVAALLTHTELMEEMKKSELSEKNNTH